MNLTSMMMDLMTLLGQDPKMREKQLYPRKGQQRSVMTANRRLHKKFAEGRIKHKPVGPIQARPTEKMLHEAIRRQHR